jgi:hypothetical protein
VAIPRGTAMCNGLLLALIHICSMQQVQIPVPPVKNISIISAAWRKVHTGLNFYQFLHSSSLQHLVKKMKVSSVMAVQHEFQYLHQLELKYLFHHLMEMIYIFFYYQYITRSM